MAGSQGFASNYALWMFLLSLDSLWSHGNTREGAVQLEADIHRQETAAASPAPLQPLPWVSMKQEAPTAAATQTERAQEVVITFQSIQNVK